MLLATQHLLADFPVPNASIGEESLGSELLVTRLGLIGLVKHLDGVDI